MESLREYPLDVRLSAYLDEQLSAEERQEIDDLLKTNQDARDLLQTLKQGSEFGNQAFEDMLKDPVPLSLVRAVRGSGSAERPVRQAANGNNVLSFLRFVPQAIAASAVLLLAGGYSGYYVGLKNAAEQPAVMSETTGLEAAAPDAGAPKTRGFTFDAPEPVATAPASVNLMPEVASVHSVYAAQGAHFAGAATADRAAIMAWLGQSTGVAFSIPDLSAKGLTFRTAQLIAIDGRPAAGLFYTDASGALTAIYYLKGEIVDGRLSKGGSEILSGSRNGAAWFAAVPAGTASLDDVAGQAAAAL